MRHAKTRWLLVGLLCLGLWPMVAASAQETRWDSIMADAVEAYEQADYAEAEKLLLAALKEAEKFGEQDPRLAQSLHNLAVVYREQGKYTEAEPLSKRALSITEKTLGPEHPNVATMLKNYTLLLRKMGRDAEAEEMEARAKAIRAKYAQGIPKEWSEMNGVRVAISLIALLIPVLANAGDVNQDLIQVAKKGDAAAVEVLLAGGADVNARTKLGETALMAAAGEGHIDAIKAL